MNREDMRSLLNHIITVSRHWHLEYAKLFISDSAYQQIVEDRDTFDKSLLEKGEDIINNIERESNVKSVEIFFDGHSTKFTTDDYSTNQLRQIVDMLEDNKDVDSQNTIKKVYIENDAIVGYEVTYQSEYKEKFTKE